MDKNHTNLCLVNIKTFINIPNPFFNQIPMAHFISTHINNVTSAPYLRICVHKKSVLYKTSTILDITRNQGTM